MPLFLGHEGRRWKNFLIRPGMQFRFSAKIALAALFLSLLNIAVFYHYIKENYEIFIDPLTTAEMIDSQTSQILYNELSKISSTLLFFSLAFTFVALFLGVLLSHKIAGPMVAFKRTFNEVQEGNLNERISLRPKDEFQDVANSFNQMMDNIQRENSEHHSKDHESEKKVA